MSPSNIKDDEPNSLVLWNSLRDRLFYRTNGQGSYWAWAGVEQLDLTALITQFGRLAPTFFQLQVSDGHVAIRVYDDVVLVGIAQIAPASWACMHTIYAAAQADALLDLRMCADLASEHQEPEVRDAAAPLH